MKPFKIALVVLPVLGAIALSVRQGPRASHVETPKAVQNESSPIEPETASERVAALEVAVAENQMRLDKAQELVKQQLAMLDSIAEVEEKYDRGDLAADDYLHLKRELQARYSGSAD